MVEPVGRWNQITKPLISLEVFGSTFVPPHSNFRCPPHSMTVSFHRNSEAVDPRWNQVSP